MTLENSPKADTLGWLLETEAPGIRYLALRDLVSLPADDGEISTARRIAHQSGPIATIVGRMDEAGFWSQPGPGYNPKYFSTVWSIILLAQLGASIQEDERIARACAYLLDNALTPGGQFSTSGAPSGTVDCLQGNLCWAMLELGAQDRRLETAFEWMARSVTGEGIAPMEDRQAKVRYYAGKCGPGFACGANNQLPCAWGATKVMLAFGKLPLTKRTPIIEEAIHKGIEFLLSVDPASAAYPSGFSDKPNRSWWKLGFPVFYVTDVLQILKALAGLGYKGDPRLGQAVKFVWEKQDAGGRWPLEYEYNGKTWAEFGKKGQPNKWVTLRALRALKTID